jgi:hypothetical protein
MDIRRVVLDVDKALARPQLTEIAAAIEAVSGVQALNITVTEIDIETVGMEITIEGELIEYEALVRAIEGTGSVVHSVDELATGSRLIENVERQR